MSQNSVSIDSVSDNSVATVVDPVVSVAFNAADVTRYVNIVIKLADAGAGLLPGQVGIVVQELVTALKAVSSQPWFADVIVSLVTLVKSGKQSQAVASLKALAATV